MALNKAVFLDRDGTINVEKNYLYRPEDWEWTSGAIQAIRGFNELGYLVIVVSNQAGIARGYYSREDVVKLHSFVDGLLRPEGARIDAYYICPHHPDFGEVRRCECRKPEPGLLVQAKADFNIDILQSYMIGDKKSDILAGIHAGARPILVRTGYGSQEEQENDLGVPAARDLLEAYDSILMKR